MPKSLPERIRNKVLWLDGADADSISLLSNSVIQWRDKSGLANHANQASSSNQPTYVTKQVNNKNIVRFNGSNNYMVCTDDTSLRMGNREFAIFAVHVLNAGFNRRICMKGRDGSSGSNFRRYNFYSKQGTSVAFDIDSDTQAAKEVVTQTISVSATRATIAEKDNTNTDVTILSDDTVIQTLDTGVYDTIDETNPLDLFIGSKNGSTFFLNGDLCELLIIKGRIFNRYEKDLLMGYAIRKWGIV